MLTSWSFAHDARELLTSGGLENPTILHYFTRYDTPPIVPLCTHLSSMPKSSVVPEQLCGCFLSHSLSHSGSVPVYSAKLFALFIAPQCIFVLPESSYTIFSDSRSAYAGLGALYSSHPWVP